ncbi:hypothetical protein [Pseudodesulfovibrio sp.]|uniref:hypothetical protein n=1 Tax=unclassified Pseudodesulfovibrio TaxID=2661612 RepID=UPI003B002379
MLKTRTRTVLLVLIITLFASVCIARAAAENQSTLREKQFQSLPRIKDAVDRITSKSEAIRGELKASLEERLNGVDKVVQSLSEDQSEENRARAYMQLAQYFSEAKDIMEKLSEESREVAAHIEAVAKDSMRAVKLIDMRGKAAEASRNMQRNLYNNSRSKLKKIAKGLTSLDNIPPEVEEECYKLLSDMTTAEAQIKLSELRAKNLRTQKQTTEQVSRWLARYSARCRITSHHFNNLKTTLSSQCEIMADGLAHKEFMNGVEGLGALAERASDLSELTESLQTAGRNQQEAMALLNGSEQTIQLPGLGAPLPNLKELLTQMKEEG